MYSVVSGVYNVSFGFFQDLEQQEDSTGSVSQVAGGILFLSGLYLTYVGCLRGRAKELTPSDYLRDPVLLSRLARAPNGKVPVYLAPSFVIKQVDRKQQIRRNTGEFIAAWAIENNGYSHLRVPEEIPIGEGDANYRAYERLPICQSLNDAFTLYESHSNAFTPAVIEFANLSLRVTIADLAAYRMGTVRLKYPQPRYDNLCPYLEDGVGGLGLVDLEHCEERCWLPPASETCGAEIKNCNNATCTTLVHLFPLHVEEIIEVMKSAGLQLSAQEIAEFKVLSEHQLAQRRSGHYTVDYP